MKEPTTPAESVADKPGAFASGNPTFDMSSATAIGGGALHEACRATFGGEVAGEAAPDQAQSDQGQEPKE